MLSKWIVLAVAALTAPAATPVWIADYGVALEHTREAHRPLLVVMDVPNDPAQSIATEWLEADQSALNNYELCRVDVTTEYGKRVFNATSFPHVAIIDRSGSVILDRIEGEIDQTKWEAALAHHKSGLRQRDRAYQVSKPVLGASGFVVPGEVETESPAKPYCAACQRK